MKYSKNRFTSWWDYRRFFLLAQVLLGIASVRRSRLFEARTLLHASDQQAGRMNDLRMQNDKLRKEHQWIHDIHKPTSFPAQPDRKSIQTCSYPTCESIPEGRQPPPYGDQSPSFDSETIISHWPKNASKTLASKEMNSNVLAKTGLIIAIKKQWMMICIFIYDAFR